ncbi:3-carboxy-cis,cis-muconate cycloisomerase [Polaromonas sp. JS666]|uniref:3-carboxy-cis,cis-muconate cycloisomerase n=1 Tax=Polaromonas sp. (strain JS666 / ATCC BAA-500) TaxID=296591 RepID=UPI00088345A0|nr:3-carboxy-cis,cis-muconate cycloisomerase [Polaromonas sp. JS666]SDM81899.1 3-carboxy-cis,cis-muconate cycloisomerase [Polaromonas sp. JS666]
MSSIFEGFLSTPEVLDAFSERNFIDAMLRFEASLARAQAGAGLIPEAAAQSIVGTCKVELFDVAKIVRESGRAGSIAIPLVKSLKETVALFNKEAAAYVHFGSTSQDVIDTALALVTRNALNLVEADIRKAVAALLVLARRHAADPVMARTLMQPASVTSFGFKCAGWAAPLARSLLRLRVAADNALAVQLGGAVGTLAQMQGKGPQIIAHMAADLKLKASAFPWHTQRDEWVALGCELGLLVGSLGKVAKDISLMGQYEIGELAEPTEPGRGGSSAMPHKRNPVACMVALAASARAPQRVAALLAAMPQEHERALGNWQAELAEWPGLLMSAHGSVRAMAHALPGLQVDTQRMRANLDALRAELPPDAAEEWFNPELATQAAAQAHAQADALQALVSQPDDNKRSKVNP